MADEKKKATKKHGAAKDATEKDAAKKGAAKKDAAAKKSSAKKTSAKKTAKKAAKKSTSKKATRAGGKAAAQEGKGGQGDGTSTRRGKRAAEQARVGIMVRASSRYVRVAPRKARLVADQVRGLHIEKARALLRFSPRSAAMDIHKLIESAASNAENNHDLVADEMRIAEITVDEGPTLRRFRPRAMGRATPINKRTSHIAVALSPEQDGN
jgi:large subunit ribosomal protein L22